MGTFRDVYNKAKKIWEPSIIRRRLLLLLLSSVSVLTSSIKDQLHILGLGPVRISYRRQLIFEEQVI